MRNLITIIQKLRGTLGGLAARPITIQNSPYMPLNIECIGEGPDGLPAIAVSHTYEQNGDLMRDPEICFQWMELASPGTDPERIEITLHPFSFRNDGLGIATEYRYRNEDGRLIVNAQGIRGVEQLCRIWDKNLSRQGFVVAAYRDFNEDPNNAGRVAEEAALYQAELFDFKEENPQVAKEAVDPGGLNIPLVGKDFKYEESECLFEIATGRVIPIDQLKFKEKAICNLTVQEREEFLKSYHLMGYDGKECFSKALTAAFEKYADKAKWAAAGMGAVLDSAMEYPSIEAMPLPADIRLLVDECYPVVSSDHLCNHAYWLEARKQFCKDLYSIADGKTFSSPQTKLAFKALFDAGYNPVATKRQGDVYAILLKKGLSIDNMNSMRIGRVTDKAGQEYYALFYYGDTANLNLNFQAVTWSLEWQKGRAAHEGRQDNAVQKEGAEDEGSETVERVPPWASDEEWDLFHKAILNHNKEISVGLVAGKRLGQMEEGDWEFDRIDYLMQFPPTKEIYDKAYQKNAFYLTQHVHPEVLHLNNENFRRFFIRSLMKETNRAIIERMGLRIWEMTRQEYLSFNEFYGDEFRARITHVEAIEKAHAAGERIPAEVLQGYIRMDQRPEDVLKEKILFPDMRMTPYFNEVTYMTEAELAPYHEIEAKRWAERSVKPRRQRKSKGKAEDSVKDHDGLISIPVRGEVVENWAWEPGNRVSIPGKFIGVIKNVNSDGRVVVRIREIEDTERFNYGEIVFAPATAVRLQGDEEIYKREDLKPVNPDVTQKVLKPVVFQEGSTPVERAAAVYKFVLEHYRPTKMPEGDYIRWMKEMKALAKDPGKFESVVEMENNKQLKVGDPVHYKDSSSGNGFGYVVRVSTGYEDRAQDVLVSVLTPGSYVAGHAIDDVERVSLTSEHDKTQAPVAAAGMVKEPAKKYLYKDMCWERGGVTFEILPPWCAGNPRQEWEAGVRIQGAAQEVKYTDSKEKAVKFLDDYDVEAGLKRFETFIEKCRNERLQADKRLVADGIVIDNPYLKEKISGLPDLEGKYSVLQTDVARMIAGDEKEFPREIQLAAVKALNSEQGAKMIMKYQDNAAIVATAGVYLAYRDRPEILKRYMIPEYFSEALAGDRTAEGKGKYSAEDAL